LGGNGANRAVGACRAESVVGLVGAEGASRAVCFIKGGKGAERPRSARKRDAAGAFMTGETKFAGECSNAVVAKVANIDCVVRAHSDTKGVEEKRGSAIAIQKGGSGATCDCGHYAKGGDHADAVVASVSHKEVAIGSK